MVKIYTLRYRKNVRTTIYVVAVLLWVLFCNAGKVSGQYTKVYAQYVGPAPANTGGVNGAGGTAGALGAVGAAGTYSISNPVNVNDLVFTDFAGLNAQSGKPGTGVLPGDGGASSAYMNMNFTGAVTPASGTPIIIKLQATSNSSGLLGSLFAVPLAQVSIQAYNGVTPVGTPVIGTNLASTSNINEYVFQPTGACNSIRITVTTDPGSAGLLGLLGGGAATASASIFYAYIFDPTCNPGNYTATSVTGVSLGGNIANPNNAIDDNLTTNSLFSVGIGLGSTLRQNVYFSGLSSAGEATTVTLSVPPALVSVGLLGSTNIIAYNGTTQVGSVSFSSLLAGTDLLTLLQSGSISTVTFAPGAPFNRVEVTLASLAGVATSLNLYEVQRTPTKPTFTLPINDTVYVCSGSQAVLKADPPGAGKELRWYASALATNTTILHTGDSFVVSNVTIDTVYWVASGRTGCTASSERVPVRVLVRPLPGITFSTPFFICQKSTIALLNYTAPVNSPTIYSITWGALAVTAGFANVPNTAFPASPVNITAPATAAPQPYPGTFLLRNALGCQRSYPFTLTVQATPHPPPPSTTYQ